MRYSKRKAFEKVFELPFINCPTECGDCPCQDCEENTEGCGDACERYGRDCNPHKKGQ